MNSLISMKYCSTDSSPIQNGLLSSAPMVLVGDVSYVIYLFHWPFVVYVANETDSHLNWGNENSGEPKTPILIFQFVSRSSR